MEETPSHDMVYVHVNETDRKILARLISDARRPHELAGYPEFSVTRQYINTQMIRMKDLGWAENRVDGLYAITPLGRRKFAELDSTQVDDLEDFVLIYGPQTLELVMAHFSDYDDGRKNYDANDMASDLEIRVDHLEVALDILTTRLGGETDDVDPTTWIADADEVDESADRVEREQATA